MSRAPGLAPVPNPFVHTRPLPWLFQTHRRDDLRYFSIFFTCTAVFMALLLLAMQQHWLVDLPTPWVWLSACAQLGLAVICEALHRRASENTESGLLALMGASLMALSCYLYASGGHTNPLISLLLLPVAISAALLDWRSTLMLAFVSLISYSALTRHYLPLTGHAHNARFHLMQMHLTGMWMTFAVSLAMIVGLIVPMAASLRRSRDFIAQQRERMLRDEKLVAMATFAASATHQLGTPLSTLSILADEIATTPSVPPSIADDARVMQSQIALCKTTLRTLMRRADTIRQGITEVRTVSAYVASLRHQFTLLNPARTVRLTDAPLPDAALLVDDTLDQAILNLLDNAARASGNDPELSAFIEDRWIMLEIRDDGPGIPEALRETLGHTLVSSRDGIGIGLYLSNATISRLGGSLSLVPASPGTVTRIRLPRHEAGPETR